MSGRQSLVESWGSHCVGGSLGSAGEVPGLAESMKEVRITW